MEALLFLAHSGDLLSLTLKLEGTDLDELKNSTVVDVKPLRQTLIAEATVTRCLTFFLPVGLKGYLPLLPLRNGATSKVLMRKVLNLKSRLE